MNESPRPMSSGSAIRRTPRSASLLLVIAAAALALPSTAAATTFPAPATPEPIASKSLGCEPGQIDVNSASIGDLQALDLPKPVATRVIEHRQPLYLDLEDLLAVEGIGEGKLAQIRALGKACADLPRTPPPTDDRVCAGHDGRIDVNRPQSRAALAGMFGGPTADRIVQGIPYAGVASVIADHVPGAGKGKTAKLADRLCATPPTIDHAGIRWGWASDAGGRIDHPGGGTLTVPADTVTARGAWASVQPLPWDDTNSGPRYDMRLHAPGWADGRRVVYATLPPDPLVAPDGSGAWTPAILHGPPGSEDVHAADGVHRGADGRVTAAVTHLSAFTSMLQPASTFPAGYTHLSKEDLAKSVARREIDAGAEDLGAGSEDLGAGAEDLGASAISRAASDSACTPDTSSEPRLSVWGDPSSLLTGIPVLGREAVAWCAEGPIGGSARLKLSNRTGLAFTMVDVEPADAVDVDYTPDAGLFERLMMENTNRNVATGPDPYALVYGPRVTVLADLSAAAKSGEFQIAYDPLRTSGIVITRRLDAIPGLGEIVGLVDCLYGLASDQWSATRILGCASKALRGLVLSGLDVRTYLRRLKALIRAVNVFELAATGIDALRAYYDNVLGRDSGYNGTVYAALKPIPRAPGGGGAPLPGGGLDGTLPAGPLTDVIVGSASGYPDQLTRGGDGIAHRIPDGEAYRCLTRVYLIRDRASDEEVFRHIRANGTSAASCAWVDGEDEVTLPPGSRNFIMRETTRTSWLLDATGHVRWIQTGAVYDCLAQRYFVIDNRAWDEITAFPGAEDGQHASCA